MMEAFKHALMALRTQAMMMIARAVVRGTSEGKLRQLQIEVFADEVIGRVEHFESYGVTFRPLDGAEALALFVGGNRDHPLVVATPDRRYRPADLAPGEGAIYHYEGHRILLKKDGLIRMESGPTSIEVRPDGITFTSPPDGIKFKTAQ